MAKFAISNAARGRIHYMRCFGILFKTISQCNHASKLSGSLHQLCTAKDRMHVKWQYDTALQSPFHHDPEARV